MIDLRSDTVTRPTRAMRRAMFEAAVGDDVFGEDPTVNQLEEYVAALLGKEAALYCPSGTMTNQIGLHVATDRGDEVILQARRARKAFGGGMRQAGVIAAASLHAFEHHVDRLAEDHECARRLAAGLAEAGYRVEPPETNIVLVEVGEAGGFLQALKREGVLATPRGKGAIRMCTHLDVGDQEIDAAVAIASRLAVRPLER